MKFGANSFAAIFRALRVRAKLARSKRAALPLRLRAKFFWRRVRGEAVGGAGAAESHAQKPPGPALVKSGRRMALVVDTAVCARRTKALYTAWQVRALRHLGVCAAALRPRATLTEPLLGRRSGLGRCQELGDRPRPCIER